MPRTRYFRPKKLRENWAFFAEFALIFSLGLALNLKPANACALPTTSPNGSLLGGLPAFWLLFFASWQFASNTCQREGRCAFSKHVRDFHEKMRRPFAEGHSRRPFAEKMRVCHRSSPSQIGNSCATTRHTSPVPRRRLNIKSKVRADGSKIERRPFSQKSPPYKDDAKHLAGVSKKASLRIGESRPSV